MDIALPPEKLSLGPKDHDTGEPAYVVLLSAGSFNPPTYMHLRLFELARVALNSEGFFVIGGYMSPVNDAYKKRHSLKSCLSVVLIYLNLSVLLKYGFHSRTICRDYGVVCTRREGQDIENRDYGVSNIRIVDGIVPNRISSTIVRDCVSRGLSVKYLVPDEVIDYIKQHNLYTNSA